ncbi:hypothetical protein [Janthinobacterium sp. UMAB-56]|uniref:hypothetical protein n=1 Tax=Janthinobacterium sp. UMAB-56 TaxID=1365361 RepID=UPI001C5998DF|nr:hypothetical protein [Janthinobacterium sp. UMAB-56]
MRQLRFWHRHDQPMQLLKKTGLIAGAILFLILLAGWLFIKVSAARNATVYSQQWNEQGTCVIKTYVPHYGNGVPHNIVRALSTSTFFRVYHKDGTLLESTEWVLDMHEDGLLDHARWGQNRAIYPTDMGDEGWTLPECA